MPLDPVDKIPFGISAKYTFMKMRVQLEQLLGRCMKLGKIILFAARHGFFPQHACMVNQQIGWALLGGAQQTACTGTKNNGFILNGLPMPVLADLKRAKLFSGIQRANCLVYY